MFFKNYNTIKVNGKTINLPHNYNSLSIINNTVYVDGVRYDGDSIEEVKKNIKKIDFDETIIAISADVANVNVEIIKDSQSNISYDGNEYEVNVSNGFIDIKSKSDNINSDVTIHLSKKNLSSILNLNIDYDGNINFKGTQEELTSSLSLITENGNIKVNSNTTGDVTLHCENGNIKSQINCNMADIQTTNGNVKSEIRVKEDSSVKVRNGNVKLCTLSEISHRVKNGNAKIKNTVIDRSTIDVSIVNGNLKTY